MKHNPLFLTDTLDLQKSAGQGVHRCEQLRASAEERWIKNSGELGYRDRWDERHGHYLFMEEVMVSLKKYSRQHNNGSKREVHKLVTIFMLCDLGSDQ